MKVLLCTATEAEVRPTLDWLATQNHDHITSLVSGIGLMAATYTLTRHLLVNQVDFVVQAGIAGSFDARYKLGDVVVVEREMVADMGVLENKTFHSPFEMGLADVNTFPYSGGWLHNNRVPFLNLPCVNGITVNEVSTQPERIRFYQKTRQAQVESMEGAALHYVCLLQGLPFVQLRAISNQVGQRNKALWEMEQSIHNLNQQLQQLLSNPIKL